MKVTALQMNLEWTDITANIWRVHHLVDSAPASDLYVLPEMWSTGFVTDPRSLPLQDNEAFEVMKAVAIERDAAVCGSLAFQIEEKFYNRHFFVTADGSSRFYDKHHLFTVGGENEHYQAGSERIVAEWRGWRFRLLTCYDLRFPVWCRYVGDYDAAIVVANWPASRITAWQILTKARAIENQCFLIGCNRVGEDPKNHYNGCSVILDPLGRELAIGAEHKETTLTAEISLDKLQHFRTHFPVLEDRDRI